jgi:gliding motility-associated-like protein
MKKVFLLLLNLIIYHLSFAQNSASNWYFGNKAGINFTNNEASVKLDGAMESFEGCSSISDEEGNLLFYSNGMAVWNKNHSILTDGSGLKGHESSTQSSIFIASPLNQSQFFLFTTNALEYGLRNELNYSIITINKESGQGEISNKNTLLHDNVTERLTALKHANNRDTWLITHEWGTNNFFSYLITAEGINQEPVRSGVGSIHVGGGGYMYNNQNSQGAIKVSPSGDKIAVALSGSGIVEVFDFNPLDGSISNGSLLNISSPYGLEFSPDGSKLYISTLGSSLYQLNLDPCDGTINTQPILIASTGDIYLGSMQLGPDKKIYVARYKSEYLGIINQPNKAGQHAEFVVNGIWVGGRQCLLGLPNFEQRGFYSSAIEISTTCTGKDTKFKTTTPRIDSIKWQIGGPENIVSSQENFIHTFNKPGKYKVEAAIYYQGVLTSYCRDINIITTEQIDLGKDTTICNNSSIVLDASKWQGRHYWSNNSSEQKIAISEPGIYWVTVDNGNCLQTDSIVISTYPAPKKSILGNNTIICDNEEIILDASSFPAQYIWQDNSTSAKYIVTKPGIYSIEIHYYNCVEKDTIIITSTDCPFFVPNVFTPNQDGINDSFYIKGLGENWSLTVFNRWGNKVFEAKNYKNDWEGNQLSGGIYFYTLSDDKRNREYKGWVQILK